MLKSPIEVKGERLMITNNPHNPNQKQPSFGEGAEITSLSGSAKTLYKALDLNSQEKVEKHQLVERLKYHGKTVEDGLSLELAFFNLRAELARYE